jgi:DNA primase
MLSPADEIKSRLDIIEIIRQYIPLKPAGVNFVARCPFHNEKTPSFTVSPTKQVWHCFGCGKGGDLFSFIMEIEKITFVEALRLLAPKAGIVLQQESGPVASLRNRLLDLLAAAAGFYHHVLLSAQAKLAQDYLEKRGVSEEIIEEWQLGYAPDSWDDLIIFLKSKGFNEKEIALSGLGINRENTNRVYNRFRGRIMFPIREVNGNIIGFTGRLLPEFEKRDAHQGKYINSPQSMVYDKGKVLFGLDKAKASIREHNMAIVVEGQMDCLTAHQFGFSNVVASSGTALTAEQAILLKRFTTRVAFAFDMDAAGRQALDRGSEQAFHAELEALAVSIPNGKDPDECIRRDLDTWKKGLEEAVPVMEYHLQELLKEFDETSASGRRSIAQRMLPRILRIVNAVERDFWIKKLSQALDTAESFLREALEKHQAAKPAEKTAVLERKVDEPIRNREEILSEQLVALLISFPELIDIIGPYMSAEQIVGSVNQVLYRQLVVYYNKITAQAEDSDAVFGYSDFRTWLLIRATLTLQTIQLAQKDE